MTDPRAIDPTLLSVRTRALVLIDSAQAEGLLTPVNAFEHRAFVTEARSADAIERLVAGLRLPDDLPLVQASVLPVTEEVPLVDAVPMRTGEGRTAMRVAAILASEERKGFWTVPDTMEIEVMLGSVELDLRGAYVTSDVLEIDYSIVLGSLTIIVPPGVEVTADNETWLGSFEHKAKRNAEPVGEGFLLKLVGVNRFGSVEIVEKLMPTGDGALKSVTRWLRGD